MAEGKLMAKIYVASSWKNHHQPGVVHVLRGVAHEVYDFRRPTKDNAGFSWKEVDPNWQTWTHDEYLKALDSEEAKRGFSLDMNAMKWADICVLVLSAGSSAHLELGWFAGYQAAEAARAVTSPRFVFEPSKRSIILLAPDYDDDEATEYLHDVAGHSMRMGVACAPCGDIEGCWLTSSLERRKTAVRHRPFEPELMYKMADAVVTSIHEVIETIEGWGC